jgi:hypothetical protein
MGNARNGARVDLALRVEPTVGPASGGFSVPVVPDGLGRLLQTPPRRG